MMRMGVLFRCWLISNVCLKRGIIPVLLVDISVLLIEQAYAARSNIPNEIMTNGFRAM